MLRHSCSIKCNSLIEMQSLQNAPLPYPKSFLWQISDSLSRKSFAENESDLPKDREKRVSSYTQPLFPQSPLSLLISHINIPEQEFYRAIAAVKCFQSSVGAGLLIIYLFKDMYHKSHQTLFTFISKGGL